MVKLNTEKIKCFYCKRYIEEGSTSELENGMHTSCTTEFENFTEIDRVNIFLSEFLHVDSDSGECSIYIGDNLEYIEEAFTSLANFFVLLTDIPNLKRLIIIDIKLDEEHFDLITILSQLEELELENNNLTSISGISKMVNLKIISIYNRKYFSGVMVSYEN